MKLSSYLVFDGQCEEAMNFYSQVFDGEISVMNYYGDSPMNIPASHKQKVMHAEMIFENNSIQGCDSTPEKPLTRGNDFCLSISVVEVFVLDRVFNRLATGGTVTMALQDTFWGARFGTITDKFGVKWMFSCDLN